MALGLLERLRYVLASGGFPLGDGGLFATMIRDLQRAHYALPRFTSYNGAHIPFAYPPLGFYVTGLVADATHLPLYTVMLVLPMVANVLAIGALYLFARAFFTARTNALAATLVFALMLASFWFTIEGGGITRSLALLFALVALWQLQRLYVSGARRYLLGAGVAVGLAALSHLEFPLFVAESAVVLLIFGQERGCRLRHTLAAGLVALVLTRPWLLLALRQDGVAPFVHGMTTGNMGVAGLSFVARFAVTQELLFPVLAAIALAGCCACFILRRAAAHLEAAAAVPARLAGAKMYGSVPLALLAGVGVGDVLLPLLAGAERLRLSAIKGMPDVPQATIDRRWLTLGRRVILSAAIAYAAIAAARLPQDERAAMQWVAQHTPPDSRFLVVGADQMRTDDEWELAVSRTTEWFPALAQRTSVSTVEGQEWLGNFYPSVQAWHDVIACMAWIEGCSAWTRGRRCTASATPTSSCRRGRVTTFPTTSGVAGRCESRCATIRATW